MPARAPTGPKCRRPPDRVGAAFVHETLALDRQWIRNNQRHTTLRGTLFDAQVSEPVGQPFPHVVEVSGSRGENGQIPRPTKAFVALGTISWNVKRIPAKPPDNVAVQLVQQLVGAFECTDSTKIRMDDHGLDVIW